MMAGIIGGIVITWLLFFVVIPYGERVEQRIRHKPDPQEDE